MTMDDITKRQIKVSSNCRLARRIWGELSRTGTQTLKQLTQHYRVSVADGDLSLIDGNWYVTHGGLLRLATRRRCFSITVRPVPQFCDLATGRWVFKACVCKTRGSARFEG